MKTIMVMFDSLNRHYLSSYGCQWTHTPNFHRLAQRTVTFDSSYICSMPCMPARRDLHTGRPGFLHRSWGPLEPYDDSLPQLLRDQGISSHLISDHYHYWEDGGSTYHGRYTTWDAMRGQEGDPCIGQIKPPTIPPCVDTGRSQDANWRQDWINRAHMSQELSRPQPRTMKAGIDFLHRNHHEDNWFLQIETFDPHEPFDSPARYKKYFDQHYAQYEGNHFDWPAYRPIQEASNEVEHARFEYASLLAMCDHYLGTILDTMDSLDLWQDTMLIVWTDHGLLLGEHGGWGKTWLPYYEEVARTPFFVWDPRTGRQGQRCQALVQPAIDLAPTILDFHGLEPTPDMLGCNLTQTIAYDTPVRKAAIFGTAGGYVNVCDGRHVYMRAPVHPDNEPLYEYTLMPTRARGFFPTDVLKNAQQHKPFTFTKGCSPLQVPWTWPKVQRKLPLPHLLFDLHTDPDQQHPIQDQALENIMIQHMLTLMRSCDAPAEQQVRLGLLE